MSTEIATQQTHQAGQLILDPNGMNNVMLFAQTMASGVSTVPKHLQGNVADCMAICIQSMAWGMSPFAVAQKTHLVSGTLGYEAQLLNAVISSSTAIEGRFHYQYGGDWKSDTDPTAWVQVGAVIRGEQDITWGEPLYPANVKIKNSPLWKSNPKQQSAYLALKYWSRLYTPAVILGVYSVDELQDKPKEKDITPDKPESAIRGPKAALEVELVAETGQDQQEQEIDLNAIEYQAREQILQGLKACETVKDAESFQEAINTKVSGRNQQVCLAALTKRIEQLKAPE